MAREDGEHKLQPKVVIKERWMVLVLELALAVAVALILKLVLKLILERGRSSVRIRLQLLMVSSIKKYRKNRNPAQLAWKGMTESPIQSCDYHYDLDLIVRRHQTPVLIC